MKIAIIGAGAMGCLFGGHLAAVADVCLYDVNQVHVDAINQHGLLMSCGDQQKSVLVRATTNPMEIGLSDAVIFFTKFTFLQAAVKDALHCIGPDTFVVTLQNGIGSADVLAECVNRNQVAYGLTAYTSDMKGPGHIELTTLEQVGTYFWPLTGVVSEKARQLEKTMNAAGFETQITQQVDQKIWKKLMVNCSENTLCALLRVTVGQLIHTPASFELVKQVVHEVAQVAQAKGIALTYDEGLAYLLEVSHAVEHHLPSMALDVEKHRKTEIAVLNEAVATEGARLGVPTPTITLIAKLIRALEENYAHFAF